ncbi:MAG: hypothetical protein JW940_39630 [Polyangiaceae bacterium]|nr:hypothetical protein [Polyangiaceae bacterium]
MRLRAGQTAAGFWLLIAVAARCLPQPLPRSPSRAQVGHAFEKKPSGAEAPAAHRPATSIRTVSPSIRAALDRVRTLRGLEPRAAVEARWVTRSELRLHVRTRLLADNAVRMAAALEALLFGLDVVPVDFELVPSMVALTSDSLAGLYDPHSKKLLIATDLDREQTEGAVEHELVHALQDQHFGIDDRLVPAPDGSDRASALESLAEGDATCAASGVLCTPTATPLPAEALPEAVRSGLDGTGVPAVLRRFLMAPYADGVALVRWLLERGGWALVNAVWARPPETSEQVLHPEKLLAREPAESVPVPAAPHSRFGAPAYSDVLGEQALRVLLAEWLPGPEAANRAAGWGGDRLALYQQARHFAVAWHIRYDNVAAAARGLGVLCGARFSGEVESNGAPRQQHPARPDPQSEASACCRERAQRGPLAWVRNGCDIAVAIGPFVRNAGQSRSDGTCSAALAWAQAVAAQK